jgi:hypothetical protein
MTAAAWAPLFHTRTTERLDISTAMATSPRRSCWTLSVGSGVKRSTLPSSRKAKGVAVGVMITKSSNATPVGVSRLEKTVNAIESALTAIAPRPGPRWPEYGVALRKPAIA